MRDLSAHEKSEVIKLTKDLEEVKTRSTDLNKANEKYKTENKTLENTINELQEQVDAALGNYSKTFFKNLKNLKMSKKIRKCKKKIKNEMW
jgi:predicted RNase H-like nuclease (RuvC/YqgF family)